MNPRTPADLPAISEIWVYLSGSPLLALVLTLSAYLIGLTLYERSQRNPLANPVLIAVVVVCIGIGVIDMPYAQYFEGAQFVHFLLGTATVSLAIPIYKGFASLKGRMSVLLLSLVAGGVTSVLTAVGVARWLGVDESLVRGLVAKSVTAPIAMGIAERVQASPTRAVTPPAAADGVVINPQKKKTKSSAGRGTKWSWQ